MTKTEMVVRILVTMVENQEETLILITLIPMGGGDTDILSQTSDDSSVSELESGHQLVLKKATTEKKHEKVSLHSCVSNPDQEQLGCDNSSESDLENSQRVLKKAKAAKKYIRKINNKKTSEHSSVSKADEEVSAINLSSKSAKVMIMAYSGETAIENISKDYLYQVIKDLAGKVSFAESLNTDALFKAVTVKLVNHSCIKIKNPANLSNVEGSDIAFIKK